MAFTRRQLLRAAILSPLPLLRGAESGAPLFVEAPASRTGIAWVHNNGKSTEHWLPESMCSGCAFLDYDNDGWMDIFLVNTGRSPFFHPSVPPRNALYRNNRDGTFTDVTAKAGLVANRWGEGVAVGDFNGDGYPDLYLTCYGNNVLYRNNGDGTFTDVTGTAGVAGAGMVHDRRLVRLRQRRQARPVRRAASSTTIRRRASLAATTSWANVSIASRASSRGRRACFSITMATAHSPRSGPERHRETFGKAHGAVVTDVNSDGLLDLWVSNDTVANYLYVNRGSGQIRGNRARTRVSPTATTVRPRSGMGVDSADYDRTGSWTCSWPTSTANDFRCITTTAKYVSRSRRHQRYRKGELLPERLGTQVLRLRQRRQHRPVLSNGHPDDMVESYSPKVTWAEPLLLFHNDGRKWSDVSAAAGPAFRQGLAGTRPGGRRLRQ